MNTLLLITLTALVAVVAAGYYDDYRGYNDYDHGYSGRYGYGFRRTPYGVEAVYNNAARQQRVNHIAEHVGASSGTARYYGVPGTGRYFGSYREGWVG